MKYDIISNIQNAVLNQIEGATVIPWNNGGIQIHVQDTMDITAVLACAAEMMGDYGGDDIQITTNQKWFVVYIDQVDREEFEDDGEEEKLTIPEVLEKWPEDELPMSERPVPIKKGDIISYRVNLVKVLQVLKSGAWVEGPYGEVQEIDWEDIQEYNPDFYDDSEEDDE